MPDWSRIDLVFLDMDGTLLDLNYDNHFWREHVPKRYAEARGMDYETARGELLGRYRAMEGNLEWYSVDHWTRELGLDIALLKEEVDHLIAVHPFVVDFLDALKRMGKRRVLMTNAHQKSIDLKLDRTRLGGHLDGVVCAHDLGLAKEAPGFWERVQKVEPFDPARTLFVDDSLSVLEAARAYGIAELLMVLKPDAKAPPREHAGFPSVHDFSEVLPGMG